MAYIAFQDFAGATAVSQPWPVAPVADPTPVGIDRLTDLEWRVVAIARKDTPVHLTPARSGHDRFAHGVQPAQPDADRPAAGSVAANGGAHVAARLFGRAIRGARVSRRRIHRPPVRGAGRSYRRRPARPTPVAIKSHDDLQPIARQVCRDSLRQIAPALALMLAACGKQDAPPPPPPPTVGYVTVAEQSVTLTNQLPGRTAAYETSDVRPQVNGLVEARLFTEGDRGPQGPAALPDRCAALSGAGRQCARRAGPRARRHRVQRGACASLWRTRQDQRDRQAGLRKRADRRGASARRCRRAASGAENRADRSRTHDHPRADRRADRPVDLYHRRARHRGADRAAGDDPAARPDLCRHPAIERRPAQAAPADAGRPGGARRQRAREAPAGGRHRLSVPRVCCASPT